MKLNWTGSKKAMPIQQVTPVGSIEKEEEPAPPAERATGFGVFLGFVLVIIFIVFGELALRDLNKRFNEYFEECHQVQTMTLSQSNRMNVNVECPIKAFEANRLLVHLPFVVPLLVTLVGLHYTLFRKKRKMATRIIYFSFLSTVIWLSIHYAVEIGLFLLRYYPAIGIYVVLLAIALIIIWLIVSLQRNARTVK